jgi:hypothetical protein
LALSLDSFLLYGHPLTISALLLKFSPFILFVAIAWGMKFAFKIKTKPVTQAAIVISIVAFSSGSLATIEIYLGTPLAGIVCAVVLVVIVYLVLCLALH